MRTLRILFFVLLFSLSVEITLAQPRDNGVMVSPQQGYWREIMKGINSFQANPTEEKKNFKMDFTKLSIPTIEEYKQFWHTAPISQGRTGTCWSFSTTSYFESEVKRISGTEVKISEMYTVYWEYVEKAKRFVQERGNSLFAEGSEADAVIRIWKLYGAVPGDSYTGMVPKQTVHDHEAMFKEMNSFLEEMKRTNSWSEEFVVQNIRAILDHYMGKPPVSVTVDGRQLTPQQYLSDVLKLKLDDYVTFLSLMDRPYYEYSVYDVPDNWWYSKDYFNIPLDLYMKTINDALKAGYSICFGGDVSEAGIDGFAGVAVIPSFDIPLEYIDESARQFRFSNSTTTDDHGIHCVGYCTKDGFNWYLIKDSGSGSRNGKYKGYYMYREDFIKLKMLDFMVHKDAVPQLIEKMK